MAYVTSHRTVGLAIEASPYTYPQDNLVAGDYDFKPKNVGYSTTIEEAKRQYALGNMSALSSIMGKQLGTVTFSVDLAWGGAVATVPEWDKLLQACGLLKTVYTTTGIGWTPNSLYTNVPAVVEACEIAEGTTGTQIVVQLRGAMGNVVFVLDSVGQPVRMDFSFTGPIQSVFDRATPIRPASYDTTVPEAVLGATITAFGETLDLDKMSLDAGGKLTTYPDPAADEGYSGTHVTGHREPTLSVDPYLASIATRGNWARLTAGTTGAFSMTIGSNLTLSAPALQIVGGYNAGERAGASTNALECILVGSSGNDEFELLQGAKA